MNLRTRVVGPLFLTMLAAVSTSSQCNPSTLIFHMSECYCSNIPFERFACQGSDGPGCDPLGGPLKQCPGGTCYYIQATSDFCGASNVSVPPTQLSAVLGISRTAIASKPVRQVELCSAKATNAFRSWLKGSIKG
jgi:hypothetical protein